MSVFLAVAEAAMNANVKKSLTDQNLFSMACDDVLTRTASLIRFRKYRENDSVLYQGDSRSLLVLAITGQLRVSIVSEEGTEVPPRVINPGNMVGAIAILHNSLSSASVMAVKAITVGILKRSDAQELLDDPSVSIKLSGILSSELRRMVKLQSSPCHSRAGARVSAVIEAATIAAKGNDSTFIDLPNQMTIAAMARVSKETVSRVIKSLVHKGVISKEGRRIRVHNAAALHTLATQ